MEATKNMIMDMHGMSPMTSQKRRTTERWILTRMEREVGKILMDSVSETCRQI
jgi:hypothetical protein